MIGFLGYNLLLDGDALDPIPTNVNNIEDVQISNAVFNYMEATKNTSSVFSTDYPIWDNDTIMLADFDGGSLSASNLDVVLEDITAIRIKRREVGAYNWITLKEIEITENDDFSFSFEDYFAKNNTDYEYAFVPVIEDVEGDYIITKVTSQFEGYFIADAESIYKFIAGVNYGDSQQNQAVGMFTPFGRKYPVIITNGDTNYQTGSFSGTLIGNYENTHILDRAEITREKDQILAFLTNKKPKILKDSNNNMWLIFVVSNPNVSYTNQWGNGLVSIGFSYAEIGDSNSAKDLQNAGLIPTIIE